MTCSNKNMGLTKSQKTLIISLLIDFAEYLNTERKAKDTYLEQLADMMILAFPNYKDEDYKRFFFELKTGKFGAITVYWTEQ